MPFIVRVSVLASTALLLVMLPIGAVADAAPDGVALARVGTLGRAPSGDDTIIVRVTPEGRIHVGDEGPLSLVALRDLLGVRTADRASREPDGSSRRSLLVNADASLPWVVSQWIMQTAADPRVGLYKIFFGARAREGNAAGAIGWRLPKDRGLQPTAQHVTPVPTVSVKVFQNEAQASDPEALFPLLLAWKKKRGTVFEIKAPPPRGPAVPTGFILQVVDVAARAGFDDVRFEGAAGPQGPDAGSSEWLVRHVAKLRAAAGTPTLRLGAKTIGRLPVSATTPLARGLLDEPYVLAPAASASDGPEEELVEEETETPDAEHADEAEEMPVEEETEDEGAVDARGGVIGLGGGAGGAFRGRGGSRDLRGPEGGKVEAIEAALAWLAAHQSEDGGWDADGFASWCDGERVEQGPDGEGSELHDIGVTGMALLAFLGRGYTNRGKHAYAKVVSRGLRFLKNQQDRQGCIGPRRHPQYVYDHALASLAMVVAYGMTGSPLFKSCTQRALDFIALTRNPYFGWRYGVKPGDNDMSVTGWMALALQAAKLINDEAASHGRAAPLAIDEEALRGAQHLLEKMTSPETGRTGYIQRGGSSARPPDRIDRFPGSATEAMTAVSLALRGILGEEPAKSPLMGKGFALLGALPPTWEPASGRIDLVYWYWGALALPHFPVAEGKAWRTALEKALVDHQRRDTTPCLYAGSWDPIGAWGVDGGRVYSTALAAMTLEALGPHPHLTFQRSK